MAAAHASGACARKGVRVRVPASVRADGVANTTSCHWPSWAKADKCDNLNRTAGKVLVDEGCGHVRKPAA